jgi:hypothetical protein
MRTSLQDNRDLYRAGHFQSGRLGVQSKGKVGNIFCPTSWMGKGVGGKTSASLGAACSPDPGDD